MSGKRDIRAYLNPFVPGAAEATQRTFMPPDARVYAEDCSGKQFVALLRSLRKGSTVVVFELYCLAPHIGRPDKRRRVLAERVDAITTRGAKIEETSASRTLPAMLLHAYEQIATSGRARGRGKEGRPPNSWSGSELGVMKMIWQSYRYKNDAERLLATRKRLGKAPGRTWLRNRFGSPHKR